MATTKSTISPLLVGGIRKLIEVEVKKEIINYVRAKATCKFGDWHDFIRASKEPPADPCGLDDWTWMDRLAGKKRGRRG